ncbi:MAG: hypothetical protein LBN25_03130 [Christensenellaceae bacterium]|jgi:hypothetical protein|nr:hypothetical protein [Christensenellaceae bacterium]
MIKFTLGFIIGVVVAAAIILITWHIPGGQELLIKLFDLGKDKTLDLLTKGKEAVDAAGIAYLLI